jgi:hypothetical protein
MTWQERIDNYNKETKFPQAIFFELFNEIPEAELLGQGLHLGADGRVVGTWIMGNNYTVASEFYGGYPHGYLRRIKSLFPDKKNILHLFSGHVDRSIIPGTTVDLNADLKPDYVDDAQTLLKVPLETFDLVMSDPPYSIEDAEHYHTPMVKRNVVMRTLGERLSPGCFVVWLDQVLPMFRKDEFIIEGVIGMVKSTNHRFRVIVIFKHL